MKQIIGCYPKAVPAFVILIIVTAFSLPAAIAQSVKLAETSKDAEIICRAWHVRIERTLAFQEEYKIVTPQIVSNIRDELTDLQGKCRSETTSLVLKRYAEIDQALYDDSEEGY